MNLRQIEVFRAVMLAGSVTGAARLLHVSQPGISRMLGHIELQVGLKLFERSAGKLRPTPEAQALYAEVEQVYRGVQRIDDRARDLKSGVGLSLRVLASPSTALEVVPRAVAGLVRDFPTARIYMETQLVREMMSQLARNEADLAISTLPIEHALLTSQVVGSWSMACVFGAGHAFAARRSLGLREVLKEQLVAFSPDTPQGRLVAEAAGKGDASPAQIEVRSGQVACALAACGAGIAVVDDLTARAWRSGKLEFRPIVKAPVYDVFAVRNAGVPASRLALAFVERVKAEFKALRKQAPAT
ncbi:LysR family transcriptional regulator [Ramlibacter sp. G-1-2-2]|uniref:LysR family transcriptional regulator n=1 Tax=Ramlibacter agri TaxID=2728837 RepID=A0A848H3C0_9BURK|nr:LysR family transcriptional regulator [Ramlibacter agri]NML44061.1 LysR family transcriptional regulator [Ramlibacter agri]